MSLTETSVIARVLELTGQSEQQLSRARILSLTRDARVELARRYPRLLRKTYSAITSTGGVASLATPLANADPLFTELIGSADIFASGETRKLQYLPDISTLNQERPTAFGYFTLVGTSLQVKVNGDDYDGSLSITATSIPALSSITQLGLEQAYVQIIAGWALGTEIEKVKAQSAKVTTQ